MVLFLYFEVAQLVEVAVSDPDGVFEIFRQHYGPGFDLACNINEYNGPFLGVKAADA